MLSIFDNATAFALLQPPAGSSQKRANSTISIRGERIYDSDTQRGLPSTGESSAFQA